MISSIALFGWNENTLSCLRELVASSLKPAIIILPKKFRADELLAFAKQKKIKCVKAGAGDALLPFLNHCDLLISASWPFLIKKEVLQKFPGKVLNVHASFLPKYRGRHPLNWALLNDEKEVGVTVHLVGEELDAGDILLQKAIPLKDNDDLAIIRKKVHSIGAGLVVEVLKKIEALKPLPQKRGAVSYAPKRTPEDGRIDWKKSAREIFCLVRAAGAPGPGAFAYRGKRKLIIWKAQPIKKCVKNGVPGEIVSVSGKSFFITCGDRRLLKVLRYNRVELREGIVLK